MRPVVTSGGSVDTLAVVFGDQLDRRTPEHLGLDASRDAVVMMEVEGESRRPASHVQRTVLFLSAMRHFAADLREAGWRVDYVELDDRDNTQSFEGEIARAIGRMRPKAVRCLRPGDHDSLDAVEGVCRDAGVTFELVEDPHFFSTPAEFASWAKGRKTLTMEFFYRRMRREHAVMVDADGGPVGGQWNFDKANRKAFRRTPRPPETPAFEPDEITRRVIDVVGRRLDGLPGRSGGFGWPVTPADAAAALDVFLCDRLPRFGDYQDAMWTGQPTLYHALLSTSLNLKLLDPREVVRRVAAAGEAGEAPLNAVEGFVRQILGWREFIRGVYWTQGRGYASRNALRHRGELPSFYWTGDTDMRCMAEAIGGVLDLGYAHHISRLMVTGNFALIAGVRPSAVNDWYLGMYADGVDWVTAPNTVGMALHADGGVVGTKPYAASGKYIQRMSNYCDHCRYDVAARTGDEACPFNTFYWDFLIRHRETFAGNNRMAMILKNVDRLDADEKHQITVSARRKRSELGIGGIR